MQLCGFGLIFAALDPPYNTGNDFIYADDFMRSQQEENKQMGMFDEEENRLFKNTDTNGKFHSDWCSMIYSRLMLARNLLTDDGVIFISIDDNEQENLKKCCDEVFGARNFIAQIAWEKVHTRKNSAINFSSSHEYILCYAKVRRNYSGDTVGFKRNLLPRDNTDAYSNPDNDPKGPWKTDPITAHNYYAADYTITKPNGVVIKRPQDRYWAYSEDTMKRMIAENAIVWGEGNSMPLAKRYLCDVQDGHVPVTLFSREFAGDSSQAKKQIDSLFEECKGVFDYTKPVKLITRLLQIKGQLGTNAMKAQRHLYDHIIYDSTNERDFAAELDTNTDVAVYVKLPDSFYISTPVGHYNPDWAIAFYEGTVKHIYFVAETKGSMSSMQLRLIEESKIHCAREHFKAISGDNVVYDVVDSYETLLNKVMR